MIVVDTNVIAYLYLNTEYSSLAEELFEKETSWAVPVLWRSEFRNVLSLYARNKIISTSDAGEIFEAAAVLLEKNEFDVNSREVLKLAVESGCSAYDCEFVSLALDLGVSLVTMDKNILKVFSGTARSISQYIA